MPAPRFFVAFDVSPLLVGQTMELPEAVAHHATRVARLGVGDALTVFGGAGGECAATLVGVDKRGARVRIDAFDAADRESMLDVTLAQCIAANDAMDYAVRKSVELGVAAIQPVVTERSAPLPTGERSDKRLLHWRNVVIAACEQCGRNRVPGVDAPQPLERWLSTWSGGGIVLLPEAPRSLASLPQPAAPLALLIGPEGGLTGRELEAARSAGFETAGFGPRVLRTETAGTAALAVLQARWGDLR
jgi:16S rRNA (uracil1498-N3)-methyltransferase